MRKRVRNSLIVIVLLVVILGLGFGIWKIFFAPEPPQPLKIKDLEDAHITITRSAEEYGWIYKFCDYGRRVFFSSNFYDNQNIFHDRDSSVEALALCIVAFPVEAEQMTVPAGDTIKIIYDGGQKLIIYLPKMNVRIEEKDVYLYISSDGSTYYDEALTQLACSSDSVKPLIIKDLEDAHITTTRSSEEYGYVYAFRDYAGSIFFTEEGNGHFDNQNIFHDGNSSEEALALMIEVWPDHAEQMIVPVGDTLEITYDGGQKSIIYLPKIDITPSGKGPICLYITSDGSICYDKALTQLAQKALIPVKEAK